MVETSSSVCSLIWVQQNWAVRVREHNRRGWKWRLQDGMMQMKPMAPMAFCRMHTFALKPPRLICISAAKPAKIKQDVEEKIK